LSFAAGGARGGLRAPALCLAALAAAVLAGCGGGTRQDAGEKSATYTVQVAQADFPAAQSVSRPETMQLQVHNPGSTTVPNVAVTVDSFSYRSSYPGLAAARRPVWVIERGPGPVASPPVSTQDVSVPGGGYTAYVDTWALGPLPAGATHSFTWQVVPVRPGSYTVHYAVAAGLSGKARAELSGGGAATGTFAVTVQPLPPATHVDPATGKVVEGEYSPAG